MRAVEQDKSGGRHLKRRLPPWLVGLLLAVVVFAVALLVANVLGLGDDPVVGGQASIR
jgi:hypothetical protein